MAFYLKRYNLINLCSKTITQTRVWNPVFFLFRVKIRHASYNVPFFIPAEDDNFLVSTNPRKPIVDSYYTSYAYTFDIHY